MCLAVLDQCFPWELIIEPVVELHAASLNYTVQCGVELCIADRSCVSVLCRFWKGNIHGKVTR